LFKQVGRDARVRGRFMKLGSCLGVDQEAVERYMDRVIEFCKKLAVLMHIAGGQPAQGPKILSV
jgi:uncharacterized protein YgfB (UPF0149 family)